MRVREHSSRRPRRYQPVTEIPSDDLDDVEITKQQRRDIRRVELLEASIRVIRRDGPDISMDRIAAEAGVTKPILYRHFKDRAGLQQAICDHVFESLGARLNGAIEDQDLVPRDRIASGIDAYLSFVEREPELYRLFRARFSSIHDQDRWSVEGFHGQVAQHLTLVLGEVLRELGSDSGAAEPWAYGIVGMVFTAGDWWLTRKTMTRERLVAYLTSLLCDQLPGLNAEIGNADLGQEVERTAV